MGGAVSPDGRLLALVMRHPDEALALDAGGWNALIAIARAEQMIGTLAYRLQGLAVPAAADRLLADARASADQGRTAALWEAEAARRALQPVGCPVVLLKGTAYVAAGLAAGVGRSIGDLDILVPREALDRVEAALIGAGWDWVKPDAYDDAYYRRWMHELPPLIHRDRDRMIDVHHTILPLTARPTPDAGALIAGRVEFAGGLSILGPADMICHAAAHLFADGDLAGGMRNLWDVHKLLEELGTDGLAARAALHGIGASVARTLRHARNLYGTDIGDGWGEWDRLDLVFARRLVARDGWGRATRPLTRAACYVRSHHLRMPPLMLARHLWTKWLRGG